MSYLPVVALIKAKPGKEKTLENVLLGIVGPSHQEAGCLLYVLHRSVQNPGTFIFIEKWKSNEDLQAHLGSPHIAAALARQEELIESLNIMPLAAFPSGNPQKGTF